VRPPVPTSYDAAIEIAGTPVNRTIKHQDMLDLLTGIIIVETGEVVAKGTNNASGGSRKKQFMPLLILDETQRVYDS
jgi:hypothetical protein